MKALIVVFMLASTVSGLLGLNTEAILSRAGNNRDEVSAFIAASHERGYGEWAEFLLSSMEGVDLVNLRSTDFIEYFEALEEAKTEVPTVEF